MHHRLLEDLRRRSFQSCPSRSGARAECDFSSHARIRTHSITGWRRHQPLPGKPDFVFPRQKLAVLVDGCFWHGCPRHATWPKQHAAFWRKKILGNRRRDRAVNRLLRAAGWRVLRIWEHALTKRHAPRTAARLQRALGLG